MAIAQGQASFAGASGVTANTRQKWANTASLNGAGGVTAKTMQKWVFGNVVSLRGAGAMMLNPAANVVHFPALTPELASAAVFNRTMMASPTGRPSSFVAVTKSDTAFLPPFVMGLWVGGTGDIAVQGVNDSGPTTIVGVPAGTYIPGNFQRVWSSNTSATLVVAFCQ